MRAKMKWQEDGIENPLFCDNELFMSALEEFSAKSYNDASLNNILKTIGMNKGSFYYRFYNKMDIYCSLIQKISEEKVNFFDDTLYNTDFFSWLKNMAISGLKFAKSFPLYNEFWHRLMNESDNVKDIISATFKETTNNMLLPAIKIAQAKGELRVVPPELLTLIISTFFYKINNLISPELTDEETLALVDTLLDIIKNGVIAK